MKACFVQSKTFFISLLKQMEENAENFAAQVKAIKNK